MKRAGRILSLVIVTIMLCTAVCFADSAAAGSFNLVEAYPKDGATGTAMENVGVKLYFDTEFSEEVLKNKNDKAFQLVDPEGKSLPLMVLYVPKEDVKEEGVKGIILVLLDNTGDHSDVKVESNTEYTLKISKDLVADNGSTLGRPERDFPYDEPAGEHAHQHFDDGRHVRRHHVLHHAQHEKNGKGRS